MQKQHQAAGKNKIDTAKHETPRHWRLALVLYTQQMHDILTPERVSVRPGGVLETAESRRSFTDRGVGTRIADGGRTLW